MRVISFHTFFGEAVTFTANTPVLMFEEGYPASERRNIVRLQGRDFIVTDEEWDALLDRLADHEREG